jgi:hypothetical protein
MITEFGFPACRDAEDPVFLGTFNATSLYCNCIYRWCDSAPDHESEPSNRATNRRRPDSSSTSSGYWTRLVSTGRSS